MPHYYYADCFEETNGTCAPGKDTGSGLESGLDSIPPCCRNLKLDETLSPARFVLRLHDDYNTPAPGWVAKTPAEVEADYPGLIGGS